MFEKKKIYSNQIKQFSLSLIIKINRVIRNLMIINSIAWIGKTVVKIYKIYKIYKITIMVMPNNMTSMTSMNPITINGMIPKNITVKGKLIDTMGSHLENMEMIVIHGGIQLD